MSSMGKKHVEIDETTIVFGPIYNATGDRENSIRRFVLPNKTKFATRPYKTRSGPSGCTMLRRKTRQVLLTRAYLIKNRGADLHAKYVFCRGGGGGKWPRNVREIVSLVLQPLESIPLF